MKPISTQTQIDDKNDTITIYGIKYAGQCFRGLGFGLVPGKWFKIIKRKDQIIDIETSPSATTTYQHVWNKEKVIIHGTKGGDGGLTPTGATP